MSSDPAAPVDATPPGATPPPAPASPSAAARLSELSEPPTTEDAVPARRCQNCGEPLLGEHCYACGQPTKGLVRHFGSIIGDFFDSVFELDSRILRTLGPLLFKPGYLSDEYFAGRRVRYVSPVRLFVFMSLVAFFSAQMSFDIDDGGDGDDDGRVVIGGDGSDDDDLRSLRSATTVAEVEKIRDDAIARLQEGKEQAADVPGVGAGLDAAQRAVIVESNRRIAALEAATERGEPPPVPDDSDEEPSITIGGGEEWDPETNPLTIDWLPDAGNRQLNESIGRARDNIKEIRNDPNRLKDAFLSTVPTTLFVLLPLFALLLKLAYVFRRRLYMEHLIVALHSHSFLCFGLLLAILFDAFATWTATSLLSVPFRTLEVAVLVWMPIYLFLMQKRVYGQGWIMTLLKFGVLGTCYLFLISLGAGISLMISLVSM